MFAATKHQCHLLIAYPSIPPSPAQPRYICRASSFTEKIALCPSKHWPWRFHCSCSPFPFRPFLCGQFYGETSSVGNNVTKPLLCRNCTFVTVVTVVIISPWSILSLRRISEHKALKNRRIKYGNCLLSKSPSCSTFVRTSSVEIEPCGRTGRGGQRKLRPDLRYWRDFLGKH